MTFFGEREKLRELLNAEPYSGAWFSDEPSPVYRYALWRIWARRCPLLLVSMLNPSTADHRKDDPTIRRCINFAKRDGYGGIIVLNAYAFRATKPHYMFGADDPDGPLNRVAKQQAAELARDTSGGRDPVVLMAHGAHGGEGGRRAFDILHQAGCDIRCLGITKGGSPKHPLYVAGNTPMMPWAPSSCIAQARPGGSTTHVQERGSRMTNRRDSLPNRRFSETLSFLHEGQKYHATIGYFTEGRVGEVFLDASKPGSAMQAVARDAAVTASLALQHGMPLDTLRNALTRGDDGEPAGPLGRLLDLIATDHKGTAA